MVYPVLEKILIGFRPLRAAGSPMNFEQVDVAGRQIGFEAPENVREVIASLGRTEDVKFSPSNRRLAVVGHFTHKIAVFDLAIDPLRNPKSVIITGVTEISSSDLRSPHGIDFIDDHRIIVANRGGQACIFEIPTRAAGQCELRPLAALKFNEISSPGSVAVSKTEHGLYEALICNDYVNKVTRHRFSVGEQCSIKDDTVLLKKWIQFPDGICVSKNREWIAVSNHDTHAIFLYKNDSSLNASSAPDGVLAHYYPHGLRFTSADRLLAATSAGSPYVNIYEAPDSDWRGVRKPTLSLKVLTNEDYLRARISREDGGPKGIDINKTMDVLAMTCEQHPLAFFDLGAILKNARLQTNFASLQPERTFNSNSFVPRDWRRARSTLDVRYQLFLGKITAAFTASVRWVLTKIPMLSWALNRGRKLWNPQFQTKPF